MEEKCLEPGTKDSATSSQIFYTKCSKTLKSKFTLTKHTKRDMVTSDIANDKISQDANVVSYFTLSKQI